MKVVSLKELHNRLIEAGLSAETAYRMLLIQDWYMYQLGLQDNFIFPEDEVHLFDNKIGAPSEYSNETTYDPAELETYFIYKLRVSEQEARIFTQIEHQYLEELGIA